METSWHDHSLRVTGNWTARYLFLAPQYELWLDDQRIDLKGGPRLHTTLEAIVELEETAQAEEAQEEALGQHDGTATTGEDPISRHHIEAKVLSIAGIRPLCELFVDGQLVHSDRIRVENVLNPFLILFILAATSWMIYVGPDVLRTYLSQ